MGVPVLETLVLLLHACKVHVKAFLLGGLVSKMEEHLGVVACLEASLPLGVVVVEVCIEIRHLFGSEVA